MIRCAPCGFENRDGVRFCEECGASLEPTCPACRAAVPPGRKFCGSCGQALAEPVPAARFKTPESYTPRHLAEKILTSRSALEGERKQVTVLFADLKGSMELLADRDPEEARKILDPVLERPSWVNSKKPTSMPGKESASRRRRIRPIACRWCSFRSGPCTFVRVRWAGRLRCWSGDSS
jgi:hypothetical protein